MEKLAKKVEKFNQENNVGLLSPLKSRQQQTSPGKPEAPTPTPSRTLCKPAFTPPDAPINTLQSLQPKRILLKAEFEASCLSQKPRILAQCHAASHEQLAIAVTSEYEIWLLNESDTALDLHACELFGFNVGSFKEKAVGPQNQFALFSLTGLLQRRRCPVWP